MSKITEIDEYTKELLAKYEWPLSCYTKGGVDIDRFKQVYEGSEYYNVDITAPNAQLPTTESEYQWPNILISPFFLPIMALAAFDLASDAFGSYTLEKSLTEFDANTAKIRKNLADAWKEVFDEIGFDVSEFLSDDELLEIIGDVMGVNLDGQIATSGNASRTKLEADIKKFFSEFITTLHKYAKKKFGKGDKLTKLIGRANKLLTAINIALAVDKAIRIQNSLIDQAGYRQQLINQWGGTKAFIDYQSQLNFEARQLVLQTFPFLASHSVAVSSNNIVYVSKPINEILLKLVSREGLSVQTGDTVVVYRLNRHLTIHRASVSSPPIYLFYLFFWFIVWLIVQIFFFGWAWGYRM